MAVANGTDCDDGLYCTDPDTCQSGECIGPDRNCSDSDDCTLDECNEAGDSCDHTQQPVPGAEGPPGDVTCSNWEDDDCDGLTDSEDDDCVCDESPDDIWFYNDVEHQQPGGTAYYTNDGGGVNVSGINCTVSVSISGPDGAEFQISGSPDWLTSAEVEDGAVLYIRAQASATEGATNVIELTAGTETGYWNVTTCSGFNCMTGSIGANTGCNSPDTRVYRWRCPGSSDLIYAENFTYQFAGTGLLGCPTGAACEWQTCGGNGWEVGTLACQSP
jgi:hypothetical protein